MRISHNTWILVVVLATAILPLASGHPFLRDTSALKKHNKIIVLPVVIHSPETKWGLGIGTSLTFKVGKPDTLTRTSSLQALGLRTTRGQTILGLDGNIFFPGENYILRLHSSYSFFPDRYWGLGNRTDNRKAQTFSYRQFYFFPQLLRRVYKDLYVGVSLEFQQVFRFAYDKNSFYDYRNIIGLQGGIIPGAGFLVTWDSRNNAFSPTKGEFFELSLTDFENHRKNYDYSNYIFDFRKYVETRRGRVVAFQVYGNLNKGSIPLLSLASMGGNMIMRGYYSGRFRDKNLIAAQIEYRRPIYKGIGLVGFAGVGQVSNNPEDFGLNQFKCAGGAGLRIALKPKERLNLRMDYGVARHSHGFYLTLAEAF